MIQSYKMVSGYPERTGNVLEYIFLSFILKFKRAMAAPMQTLCTIENFIAPW
jgi:hypothetical protein